MKSQSGIMKSHSMIFIRIPQGIKSSSSISELMEFIQTSFLPSDFETVEKILEDWKKEKDEFEADNCGLIREKLEMEDEIERLKKIVEEKDVFEADNCGLIREKFEMEEEIERLKKIVEEKDVFEVDNCGLIREKFEMEEEIERLKKIGEEKDETIVKLRSEIADLGERFENRVSSLEKDVALIMEQNRVVDEETEQNQDADPVVDPVADPEPSHVASRNQSRNTAQFQNVINLDDDVSVPDGYINPYIDTIMHKRKKSSQSDDSIHNDVGMPAGEPVADMANASSVIRHGPRRKLSLQCVRV